MIYTVASKVAYSSGGNFEKYMIIRPLNSINNFIDIFAAPSKLDNHPIKVSCNPTRLIKIDKNPIKNNRYPRAVTYPFFILRYW